MPLTERPSEILVKHKAALLEPPFSTFLHLYQKSVLHRAAVLKAFMSFLDPVSLQKQQTLKGLDCL